MTEDELFAQSEKAFALISQYLQTNNISLRNVLKEEIYDQKIAIFNDEIDIENGTHRSVKADQTFEVINSDDFFRKIEL